jgi:hypothetical protein
VVRHLEQNAGITVDLALQDGTVLKVGDVVHGVLLHDRASRLESGQQL